MRIIVMSLVLCLTSTFALAATKPAPVEVKRVLDYYYHGKGMGPVLLEAKICQDIQREGDEKNECAGDITSGNIKKSEPVYLWMAFMVPSGDEPQNIIIQFENGGVTRMVKNLQVTGQLRYRTWVKTSLDKVGAWKVKIVHDGGTGEMLGAIDSTVE